MILTKSRLLTVLTISILACAKPSDGDDDTEADSTIVADTGDTTSETGDDDGTACGPKPADYVCVEADREIDYETLCAAAFYCWADCSGSSCEDEIGRGDCEVAHEAFHAAEPSQTCIDLLIAAETCYFGLTCGELGASSCDPHQPCYQPWLDFHTAGCEIESAPNCDWG
jgi:hypothetical protein